MNFSRLNFFDKISLSYLQDRAPLLHRKELKFILPISILDSVLKDCQEKYYVLSINNESLFRYSTNYYDTLDYKLYFDHHRGKGNRYKIREREYLQNGLKQAEIKIKTNKNQTIKHIFKINNWFEAKGFIQNHTGNLEADLYKSLFSEYTRITLLHKEKMEKVTFDFNLSFNKGQKTVFYDNILIAEVKTAYHTAFYFSEIMKKYKFRSGSISKYCLGLISLNPNLKCNNFKMKFNQFIKVNNNG